MGKQVVQVRLSAINAMGRWTGEIYVHWQTDDYQWRTTEVTRFRDEAQADAGLVSEALHVLTVAAAALADAPEPST
jgi:hypothetical protein